MRERERERGGGLKERWETERDERKGERRLREMKKGERRLRGDMGEENLREDERKKERWKSKREMRSYTEYNGETGDTEKALHEQEWKQAKQKLLICSSCFCRLIISSVLATVILIVQVILVHKRCLWDYTNVSVLSTSVPQQQTLVTPLPALVNMHYDTIPLGREEITLAR